MGEDFQLQQKIEQLLAPLTQSQGLELLELDWRREPTGWVLRLYLDHQDRPVTLEDCSKLSRLASQKLDEESLIPYRYSLEVSSPGLRRPVKKLRDYQRFLGERVCIELKEPIDPVSRQRVVTGFIRAVQEPQGRVLIASGAGQYQFGIDQIAKAHLDPEITL